jgi:D-alanyl-D-alanine carboxypeptidase
MSDRIKTGVSRLRLLLLCGVAISSMSFAVHVGAQTPKATPTPAPAASPSPAPSPKLAAAQTLDELQSKIRQRMFATEVRRGRIGIKIVSLNTGKVIVEYDADKYFMPASNMKNFTVATAMERLGPDFRFVTSVFAPAVPDAAGTIKGDLRIYGRGDVSSQRHSLGRRPATPKLTTRGSTGCREDRCRRG